MATAANALLNPFENDYPDQLTVTLNEDDLIDATCCVFNALGSYLAVGAKDGYLHVYDMLTNRPARSFPVHQDAIVSVAWTSSSTTTPSGKLCANGSLVITGCLDGSVALVDIESMETLCTLQLGAQIAKVHVPPRSHTSWLVVFSDSKVTSGGDEDAPEPQRVRWPVLIDAGAILARGGSGVVPVEEVLKNATSLDCERFCKQKYAQHADCEAILKSLNIVSQDQQRAGQKCIGVAATYNRSGEKVIVAGKGNVFFVVEVSTKTLILTCKPQTARAMSPTTWMKGLKLSHNGRFLIARLVGKFFCLFAVNLSIDEATPAANSDPAEVGQAYLAFKSDFQDTVNNTRWHSCTFSGDSEFVLGAAAARDRQNLYVWNILGQLMTILEGPSHRGMLRDADWHPSRPVIASIDANGEVHMWSKKYSENWSAFAPNFTEIEENVEHVEREDEFDLNPAEPDQVQETTSDDVVVDVTAMDKSTMDTEFERGHGEAVHAKKRFKGLPFFLTVVPDSKQRVDRVRESE